MTRAKITIEREIEVTGDVVPCHKTGVPIAWDISAKGYTLTPEENETASEMLIEAWHGERENLAENLAEEWQERQ